MLMFIVGAVLLDNFVSLKTPPVESTRERARAVALRPASPGGTRSLAELVASLSLGIDLGFRQPMKPGQART